MKKNKETIVSELLTKTNYTKKTCEAIFEVLENHGTIGRKNKEKMIDDFIEQLKISRKDADTLYNTCMEIIIKSKF